MKTKLFTIALITIFVSTVSASTYSAGHGDLGLGEGAELELHLHIHEGSTVDGTALTADEEYAPADAIILVPNSTLFSRPAGSGWDPIGTHAGDDVWALPQSHDTAEAQGSPFLGIGAEEVDSGAFVNNEITLTLTGVSGPGVFSLYTVSLGNPIFEISSFDGISTDDSIRLFAGSHNHFNFGFSQAGIYQVAFEVSAYTDTQTPELVTDSGTFTFNVIPEPATISLLALGGIGLLRRRK